MNAAINDPINNIKIKGFTTPGNKVATLAKKLKDLLEDDSRYLIPLINDLVSKISSAMRSTSFSKAAHREVMWKSVLKVTQDGECFKEWTDILVFVKNDFGISILSSLIQFISMRIVYFIVKFENERKIASNSKSPSVEEIKLTEEEQQVLYYVAGYIVYSLLKKYKKAQKLNPKNSTCNAAITFLESLKLENAGRVRALKFLEFVRSWVDIKNRAGDGGGGLIKIGSEMYLFVRRIENCVRTVLNLHFIRKYRGEDLRDAILKEVKKSTMVDQYWESLSRNIPNKTLSQSLKDQIINKWVDIRAHAFVKCYVQMLKRKLAKEPDNASGVSLSKAAEPALRKTLF